MNHLANVTLLRNPLEAYKDVAEQLKALERTKDELKAQIFNLMDLRQSDVITYGYLKAERTLVVQERVSTSKVKELLGNRFVDVVNETEVIRLKII